MWTKFRNQNFETSKKLAWPIFTQQFLNLDLILLFYKNNFAFFSRIFRLTYLYLGVNYITKGKKSGICFHTFSFIMSLTRSFRFVKSETWNDLALLNKQLNIKISYRTFNWEKITWHPRDIAAKKWAFEFWSTWDYS